IWRNLSPRLLAICSSGSWMHFDQEVVEIDRRLKPASLGILIESIMKSGEAEAHWTAIGRKVGVQFRNPGLKRLQCEEQVCGLAGEVHCSPASVLLGIGRVQAG